MAVRTKTYLVYGYRFSTEEEQKKINDLWYENEDFRSLYQEVDIQLKPIEIDLFIEGNTVVDDPEAIVIGLEFKGYKEIEKVKHEYNNIIEQMDTFSTKFQRFFNNELSWHFVTTTS